MTSSSISDGRVPEERSNEISKVSKTGHMEPDIVIQAIFVSWRTLLGHGLFQVVIQVFVRVEFRTVGGKEDEFNFVLPGRQPLLDDLAVVDPEVIDDQDDFALPIFDQLPEELDEDIRVEGFLQGHPLHFPLVVDGTDEGTMEALCGLANNRRLSLRRIAPSIVGFRLDSGLIAPPDFGFLGLGPLLNQRVGFLQPFLYLGRTLLISPFQRPLRGKSPALQNDAQALQGIFDSITLLDQLSHRIPAPQGIPQLELVRSLVADQFLDFALPFGREEAVVALAASPLLLLHRGPTAILIPLPPLANRLSGHIQIIGYCLLGAALIQHLDGSPPQLLLGLRMQGSCISVLHQRSHATTTENCKLFYRRVNNNH